MRRTSILRTNIRNMSVLYALFCLILIFVFLYVELNIQRYYYDEQDSLILGHFKQYEALIATLMLSDNIEALNRLKKDNDFLPVAYNKEFFRLDYENINLNKIIVCKAKLQTFDWGFVCRSHNRSTYYLQIQSTTNLIGIMKFEMTQKIFGWKPLKILLISLIAFWIIYSLILAIMIYRFYKRVYTPTVTAINNIKKAVTEDDFNSIISVLSSQEIYDLASILSKQAQQAALGRITQFVAHDVRRPFSQIKLVLSMFDSLSDQQKLNKAKSDIEESIKNVEGILSDLLLSNNSLKLQNCSVLSLVDKAIEQLSINNLPIKIITNIESSHTLFCDEQRLIRCLANIIENAIDSINGSKTESANIMISCRKIDKNGENNIEITIINDGPSLEEQDLSKIFEPFYTKGKKKGNGLGLAAVRRIISLHNGSIKVQNRPQKNGVEFSILLPHTTN